MMIWTRYIGYIGAVQNRNSANGRGGSLGDKPSYILVPKVGEGFKNIRTEVRWQV